MHDDVASPPTVRSARTPKRRGQRLRELLLRPVTWLAVYGVLLAGIAFWPSPVDSEAGPLLATMERLFPFLTYERIEFSANIVMFVPLGILLALVLRTERWLVLPIAFLTTVTIEAGQAVALTARTASALDIIANTAGACLGMIFVAPVEVRARSRSKNDRR